MFLTTIILLMKSFISKFLFSTGPKDRIYKYISHHINNKQKILNIGCGDGILSEIIRKNFDNITVHDVDIVDLRYNKQTPNFDLFDGYHLSQYETNSFDVIFVVYVLHHVKSRQILLDEIMRIGKNVILIEDILHGPNGTMLDHFFTLTHRIWARFICQDKEAYVEFWTKSKWFSILLNYRTNVMYTNIPEKKWYHYVNHGMFVCKN